MVISESVSKSLLVAALVVTAFSLLADFITAVGLLFVRYPEDERTVSALDHAGDYFYKVLPL